MQGAMRLAGPVSKVLARLHRWYAVAWVLSRVSVAALDDTSVGRLRYALMMAHRSAPQRTKRQLQRLICRNEAVSAELHIELAAMATAMDQPDLAATQLGRAQQKARDPETLDAATKLLRVNREDAHDTLRPGLAAKIDTLDLHDAGLLTLVPVSGKYLELWHLWLRQVRRHACGKVVAMAMDDTAYTALSGRPDVAVVDLREFFSWDGMGQLHPHTRGVLWYLRVLLLQELVRRGHPVLVLDLDAIPVGNVNAMFSAMPPADVLAQQDHSIPKDVDRQLGFVLCCGFMLWRPTVPCLQLLERFSTEAAVERDDQLALNHLLARSGVTDRTQTDGILRFHACEATFACPPQSQVSRTLHDGSVIRHFQQTGQSIAEVRAALNQ